MNPNNLPMLAWALALPLAVGGFYLTRRAVIQQRVEQMRERRRQDKEEEK